MNHVENLQNRLYHLAFLGEELPRFAAGPVRTWLYREIVAETGRVVSDAVALIGEVEHAARVSHSDGSSVICDVLAGLADERDGEYDGGGVH